MTMDRFTAALVARPFLPFVVNTVDGRSYPVSSPSRVIVLTDGRHLVLAHGARDEVAILDIQQAVSIEYQAHEGDQP